ncbi:P-loop containing nucleoside triphosphate hydrolase protein [Fomitopsis betulina]|nr:P-loop containing nucleoside triphosphate hydrolase protein [Fomitopsis betulina]
MKKDVIITTYQTLCMDFNIPSSIESENEMEYLLDHGGLLSRMKWFRIVTDESQFIRNRRTRASKVVALLRAKYRWCLTGTPVTNTLADIYGFLRFGRFRPWNDWKDFNAHVAKTQLKDAPLAGLRAQEILKPILLRRTKNAQIEGEPILQLPEKHIDLIYLDFSEEERQIYDMFEGRARVMINRYIRENTVFKNNNNILVMILRMRQLCCHPHLILELTREFEDPTLLLSGDGEKEVARASKLLGPEWVMQIKKRFMDRARMSELDFSGDMEQDMEATCPKCGDLFMDNSGRLLACGHEVCKECLSVMQTEDIEVNGELGNGDEKENNRVEKEFETAVTKGLRPCPTCKKMQNLTPSHVFLSQAFEPRRDDVRQAIRNGREQRHQPSFQATKSTKVNDIDSDVLDISSSSDEEMPDLQELLASTASSSPPPPGGSDKVKAKKEPKVKVKGRAVVSDDDDDDSPMDEDTDLYDAMKDIRGRRHAQQAKAPKVEPGMSAEMFAHWRRGDDNLESSTKMVAMIEFLRVADAAGDKTIVYSQWTSMLDLIETLFARYGIRSLRYDGRMNREEREIALAEFRQRGGPKVILISIRCGGVGLNLVSANRVVNMDLSWNYATESQAYDRVHRLGQEKEVFVQRLVVKNTIEERMLKLQDTKLGLAEAALGEGSGVKLHKLSVKELKALFGIAPLPTRGQVRVEPPQ